MFEKPKESSDDRFIVLARSNAMSEPRLGLAIAKKHVVLAVQRNRIRRVVRESFRHQRELLSGLDLVVLVRKNTAVQSNNLLYSSLEAHWQRLANFRSDSF